MFIQTFIHSNRKKLFKIRRQNYINQIGLGLYKILKLGPSFLLSPPIDRVWVFCWNFVGTLLELCWNFFGTNTMTKTILETCDIWDTDYNSDNWEPEFMTIFVTWQLRVTLDSIRNSCDVLYVLTERIQNDIKKLRFLQYFRHISAPFPEIQISAWSFGYLGKILELNHPSSSEGNT